MTNGEGKKKARSSSAKNSTWADALRVIQSAPCNDLQLARLGEVCRVDADTRMLEMSNGLTLTGECWARKFGCSVEVESAANFFAKSQALEAPQPTEPPPATPQTATAEAPEAAPPAENQSADAEQPPNASSKSENVPENAEKSSAEDAPAGNESSPALAPLVPIVPAHLRSDLIHWTLTLPLSRPEIIGAVQRIRAALNVNGCLIFTIPVRVGRSGSAAAAAFYKSLTDSPLMEPQEVSSALEEGGFEPLAVEFTPNRQALARYRMILNILGKIPGVSPQEIARWSRESKLFLKEGGVSFFPAAIFVVRRWEYVDGT